MCDSEKSVENVWDLGSIQGWSVALLFLNAHAWIEFPKMHLSFDATPAFFFSCCRPLSHIFMDGTMSENPRAKRDLWKSLIALCQDSKSSHFTIYLPRSTFAQSSDGTSILPHQTTHCIFFNFLEIKDLNPRLLWFRMCTNVKNLWFNHFYAPLRVIINLINP